MFGSQVFLHPALVTNLHGIICVAVNIHNFGGAAGEVGVGHIVHRVLHIGHHILQTVDLALLAADLVLQTGDVGHHGARDVDRLVGALVGGEGAQSLAVLLDGERGVVHRRARDADRQVSALVGREGAHGLAVLLDGERGIVHRRKSYLKYKEGIEL